jgi:histidinol phosphatase-like PHP family hydrolase
MRYETQHENYKVIFQISTDEHHPKFLDEEQLSDLVDEVANRDIDKASYSEGIPLAKGETVIIGYDSEWVERKTGVLEIQSYQFYLVGIGGEISATFLPNESDIKARLTLKQMMSVLLYQARKTGIIVEYPAQVILVGFFLRADLAMCSDLIEFKEKLSNVSGKIATTHEPVKFVCNIKSYEKLDDNRSIVCGKNDNVRVVNFRFYDIAKHAPEGARLADLGGVIGVDKLEIPSGYSIDNADVLREEQFDFFIDYGITDAKIPCLYYLNLLAFANEHIKTASIAHYQLPVSASAMAVNLFEQTLEENNLDFLETFGLIKTKKTIFNDSQGKFVTKWITDKNEYLKIPDYLVSRCYKGGRNECFYFGNTEQQIWYDYDLRGAYTTSLCDIRQIDYPSMRFSKILDDFLKDNISFCWVDFKFKDTTRFPCLPVETDTRGLNYPLQGESFCSNLEVQLAYLMGAEVLDIKKGVIFDWLDDTRIFLPFVKKIRQLRNKYPRGSVQNEYAKLVGNGAYGKLSQSVSIHPKRVFSTSLGMSDFVPESKISNALMAARSTGFVRAVMSEILHRIPDNRTVISCTTDGILTNALEHELDLSGVMSQRFQNLVSMIDEGL